MSHCTQIGAEISRMRDIGGAVNITPGEIAAGAPTNKIAGFKSAVDDQADASSHRDSWTGRGDWHCLAVRCQEGWGEGAGTPIDVDRVLGKTGRAIAKIPEPSR